MADQQLTVNGLKILLKDNGDGTYSVATSERTPGAPNIATGQATAGAASGALVAARATRRSVCVLNLDANNAAWVGPGTVTSGNGFKLAAGKALTFNTTAAINCIRDSADVLLCFVEEYD
ncbi:MAG TPA: hypothetical protein VFA21_20495 [Pyrinomonadaceae bacterium]|jgi:hypothetical protein|nr:hypothetical protein [Pyrinomonadaceae bacterium]